MTVETSHGREKTAERLLQSSLREHAGRSRLDVPEERVFADERHGATLARPGLEALRDLAAQGCLDVVLAYSPDRLTRKFACQALLIEELARCGTRIEFVKGPRGDSPEDQLTASLSPARTPVPRRAPVTRRTRSRHCAHVRACSPKVIARSAGRRRAQ